MIAPLTTLRNWLKETNRFCPSIEAFILHGTKEVRTEQIYRMKKNNPKWDLCIMSYETCRVVCGSMKSVKWSFVALDEGHKIKNEKSLNHQALCSIKSDNRLILTGTPLNVRNICTCFSFPF